MRVQEDDLSTEEHVVVLGFQPGQFGSRLAFNHYSASWIGIRVEFVLPVIL